jgi:hypothetical protein
MDIRSIMKHFKKGEEMQNEQEVSATACDDKGKALVVPIPRHPLMAHIEKEYVKELQEEADLDRELGLAGQVRMDELDVLRRDINELTSSKDFVEVSDRDVEKIFNVDWLRTKCAMNTAFSIVKMLIIELVLVSITCGFGYIASHYPRIGFPFAVTAIITGIVTGIVFLVKRGTSRYTYTALSVGMNREPIHVTRVRLPKGAKLKIKEAKDAGVFERFDIVHPTITAIEQNVRLPAYFYDPAVIGVTPDMRQFLIVCWDIENDAVKVNSKRLKNLKLKHGMKSSRMF